MKNDSDTFTKIYAEACMAGSRAGSEAVPTPMLVQRRANPLDDTSPVDESWIVDGGVCGFAWVTVRPGTSAFAKWLVRKGYARKGYYGGVDIWISAFGQSMTRKEACASAMAKVFYAYGVRAFIGSRTD